MSQESWAVTSSEPDSLLGRLEHKQAGMTVHCCIWAWAYFNRLEVNENKNSEDASLGKGDKNQSEGNW